LFACAETDELMNWHWCNLVRG